jgi:transposase
MADRRFTAEQVDAAVQALSDRERFGHAQEIIGHAAPGLQRVLDAALDEGGWFGPAHLEQVRAAADELDPVDRARAIDALLSQETRLGMLVGVAVGLELAQELLDQPETPQEAD